MLRSSLILIVIALIVVTIFSIPAHTSPTVLRLTITNEQSLNLNPMLSDDGKSVIFESTSDLADLGGPFSFHTTRANISPVPMTFEEIARSRATTVSVSQNGDRVVFASTEDLLGENSDRNSEIYLSTGPSLKQLTHTRCDNESNRLTDGNFEPFISGDGRWVTFVSNRELSSPTVQELFLIDTASGSIDQLTNSDPNYFPVHPKISADGTRLFFIQQQAGSSASNLVHFDISSRISRVVVSGQTDLSLSPGRAVSNDGNRVVYSASTDVNQTQVFLFDVRLGKSRQLTKLGSRVTDVPLNPSISGDGKRVTFVTRRRVVNPTDGSVELYLLDIPTATIQQLTDAPASATAEVISSTNQDGSIVAFNFPRVLSGNVADIELVNNSEIYLAFPSPRAEFGKATVRNAATKIETNPLIAPDSIASIIGNELSSTAEQAKLVEGKLPFNINGTTVQVNGKQSALIYASPDEVLFLVPGDLNDGPAEVLVINSEGYPAKASITIAQAAPGLFNKENEAIALNAETLLSGPFDPTNNELRVVLFGTGVRHATEVSINLGGESLKPEAVLASTFPGLDEIHVRIPAELRGAGLLSVSVKAGTSDSNLTFTNISGSSVRDIVINEILADPPDGPAGDANHDGSRDASADEFVELVNTTSRDIDLTGYQLQTRTLTATVDTVRHRFPAGTILSAGTAFVVFGGGQLDSSNPRFGGARVGRASTSGLSLSNSGGVVTLRDGSGASITSLRYGASLGIPGDANQSISRSPDVLGTVQLHQVASVNKTLFSPGTKVDGSRFLPFPAISHITITPTSQALLKGQTTQFQARAFDSENLELSDVIFTWTSTNNAIVSIESNGLAKALDPGNAEIMALGRGIESTRAMITVSAPTPSPTPTPSPSPSPTPTSTPTPIPSPSPSPTPTPSPTPSPSPSTSPTPPPLLISEFRTRGPNGASDEFVEIYNNSDSAVLASGLKIRGSSSNGGITTRLTIAANMVIPARGHLLTVNSSGYSGNVNGDQTFTSGFSNDGGVALTMADDTIIDQLGLSAGSAFKEGTLLTPLATDANQSYERKPGGLLGSTQDTQDNLRDFQVLPSDPQNTQSFSTPGPTPSPSPSPAVSPTPSPSPSPSSNPSPTPSPTPKADVVVIGQVFGGGGNAGAPFRNDFIEIFNAGNTPVNLNGWSVQYASGSASVWLVTSLSNVNLAPGQYYLIQEASGGNNGQLLPTPDVTGTIAMAATAGKVALVHSTTPLSGVCPTDSNVVDFVGYGSTAACFEGTAPAPAASNANSIVRKSEGCLDTGNNATDFATSPPAPRNTATTFHSCVIVSTDLSKLSDELSWMLLSMWWLMKGSFG